MDEKNITIDLPSDIIRKVEDIRDKLGLTSEADVVAYAIWLLDQILDAQEKGNRVILPSQKYLPSGTTTTINIGLGNK